MEKVQEVEFEIDVWVGAEGWMEGRIGIELNVVRWCSTLVLRWNMNLRFEFEAV